jgi:hypothetical protein
MSKHMRQYVCMSNYRAQASDDAGQRRQCPGRGQLRPASFRAQSIDLSEGTTAFLLPGFRERAIGLMLGP